MEGMEEPLVMKVMQQSRENVLSRHQGVKLGNGQSGSQQYVLNLEANIFKHEKGLSSMRPQSLQVMIVLRRTRRLRLEVVRIVLQDGSM